MENDRAHVDHMPGFVTRSFLDHAKALQYATCSAVSWIVCGKGDDWLRENGIKSPAKVKVPEGDMQYAPGSHVSKQQATFYTINSAYSSIFNQRIGFPLPIISRRDLLTAYEREPEGIGGQRIGDFHAGCYFQGDVANFVVASSLVRLLGAWEQFEIDALRCLVHYRPNGMFGVPSDNEMIVLDQATYEREFGGNGNREGIWGWLGKTAENRAERGRLLKQVYNIPRDCGLSKVSKSEFNKRVSIWYDTRNRIAHGRGDSRVLLSEYVDADATIFDRVMQFSRECKEKQLLWL